MKQWLVNLPKKYWTAAHILWAVVVFGLHAMSSKSFPKITFWGNLGPDKIVHAFLFFVGTAFAVFSGWKKYKAFIVWGGAGVLLEYYQFFCTTDRFFDWYDVLSDFIGVILFGCLRIVQNRTNLFVN
jgi:hypothetical protein